MHKRVLIAEQADTLRSVAETVLRQNGYEVISVSDADRAQEVLDLSRPDLLVIGADLQTASRTPFFEQVQSDPRTSGIPLLVFEPADKSELDFPDEVIIPRPFDPKDFLSKVSVFVGQSDSEAKAPAGNPLGVGDVDDDFLDAALGLDKLDVTDSEVMDKTSSVPTRSVKPTAQKVVDYSANGHTEEQEDEVSKVESLMIDEDASQIRHRPSKPARPAEGSGKLEILNDQYGLTDPSDVEPEADVHDYDWFVKSMATDSSSPAGARPKQAPATPAKASDSGKLTVQETAAAVDPVTPPPESKPASKPKRKADKGAGVEKFIDEFKREIEQLRDGEAVEDLFVPSDSGGKSSSHLQWDEKVENLTPQKVALFTEEFAEHLGQKVAEMLVAKIDTDKLTRLLQKEILQELKARH